MHIIPMGTEEAKNLAKTPQESEQEKRSECNIAQRAQELQEQKGRPSGRMGNREYGPSSQEETKNGATH